MSKFNFQLSHFWDAVHPLFRAVLFFAVSFWGSTHISLPAREVGPVFWWCLFSGAFFIAALYVLFWMEWSLPETHGLEDLNRATQ